MKIFEIATILPKIFIQYLQKTLKIGGRRGILYATFSLIILIFYISDYFFSSSTERLEENAIMINNYNQELALNLNATLSDSLLMLKERENLIRAIEDKIVTYLYQLPDYTYIEPLEPYLEISPELLNQIPSATPLEKGDFILSSKYGIRKHPISGKTKQHLGIDFAAPSDKKVYATASATVLDIKYSETGYGTHIILKHRFRFETLYGHLNKVLVKKGQKIQQHELIATVGSSGSSTGYHLHYEVIKNSKKINPVASLGLKYRVFLKVLK